ncbi:hypothetical protein [Colwellia piezophila]|uniref:hypothetical protein n=1 Tax=Colwellia piezophila TaxID=211668 RepID=UPI00036C31C8|nr:hypothetical protein [Colwellia piezophila]
MTAKKIVSIAIACTLIVVITAFLNKVTSQITPKISASPSANPIIPGKVSESSLTHQKNIQVKTSTLDKFSVRIKHEDDSYIVPCNREYYDNIYDDDFYEKLTDFHDYLAKSNAAEDKLAYVLFSAYTQQTPQLDLLQNYLQEYPDNQLALMDLIGECSKNLQHNTCSQVQFDRLSKVDSNNAALWLQIANFHAANGDKQATLNAIQKANKATQFNDYYYHYLSLFMQVSKGAIDINDKQRLITGIGIQAARSIWISDLSNFCTSVDNLANDKNHACLTLGQLMEEEGKHLVVNLIGMGIQSKIYQAENNDELLKQLSTRKETLWNPRVSQLNFDASNLMIADEKLFQYWLSNALIYGEVKAANMLIKEAILLSKNPDYNPCANE